MIAPAYRRQGLGRRLVAHLDRTARSQGYERISLVAVGGSEQFWSARGFTAHPDAVASGSYPAGAVYMSRTVPAPAVPSPLPEAS